MQRAEWDEESELRELNSRLWFYVSGVRALEEENRRLERELAALRGRERQVCRLQEREDEVAELRLVVAELSRAKGEAELERDALRQELARLERLGAQSVELRRRRLEPELAEQRQQLERLRTDCAALEALLEQLRVEHGRLREERSRRPSKLRALPPPAPTRTSTRISRRELEDSAALVLSWSCGPSLERYETELRALQELEERLGRENVQKLRTQNEQSRRQLEELHRRCRELGALAERLDQERLAQQEHQGAELAEYQTIIGALEEEKQFLTVSIAEYLKDYHELLQVKAGLSLEIATYRALLEGESSQWILMWDEDHGRKLPQGVRNMLYEYSKRHSAYQQEKGKRTFPAIQNVDTRYKSPVTNISSSAVYSSQTRTGRTQTASPGKTLRRDAFRLDYSPSAAIKKDMTHERTVTGQRGTRTFAPPYLISQGSNAQQRTLPERQKTGSTVSFLKESTMIQEGTPSPNIPTTFPPYGLSSTSNYERTIEGTRRRVSEQAKDSKLMREGKPEGREKNERLAKEWVDLAAEKTGEKSIRVERNVNVEKKTDVKEGMADHKHRVEEFTIKDNQEESRLWGDRTPKDGSYVRWEERIRVETPGKNLPADIKMKESHSFQREKNVSIGTQSKEAAKVQSEGHTHGQILKDNSTEITLQDLKPSVGKSKDDATFKLARESNQDEKESSTLLTESIAETIVSDILKDFVQKPSDARPPLDTRATSFEKREVSEDGNVKTEDIIGSAIQDDLYVSDEFDLGTVLKKDAEKFLKDGKGIPAEGGTENIVKGKEDKGKRAVQLEIVEEPIESTADERTEFSTPFEVEEVEDTLPGMAGHLYYGDEDIAATSAVKDLKQKQPSVVVSHVEEVSEGDDVVDEEKYFVSTPDEHPLGHKEDEGSIYGQIHIEEESTVKYSWQDEFLQGSQTRINEDKPELIYQVMGGGTTSYISKEDVPKEEVARAESIVIEKEIKIPHEFQESIKNLFSQESKDPKLQLKETLEKLGDTLPESVKQELSAFTKEGQSDASNLEVDIKKVLNTEKGGLVTIVAEVNLSQMLDPDQLSAELLGESVATETKLPTESPSEDDFDEYMKQEPESCSGGRNNVGVDFSSTPWTIGEVTSSNKVSSRDGVEYHTNEQVIHQGPVFKSMEINSGEECSSQGPFDINRHIRQIVVGPTEIRRTEQVLYEGPISETLEFGSGGFETGASADINQFMKELKLGPEKIQSTEKITYRGPVHKTVEVSGPESPTQAQFSTEIRSSKNITLGSNQITEETVFAGPGSDDSNEALSQMKGTAQTSRSIRHIRIDPKEVHTEHVVYEGPLSGFVELSSTGDQTLTEDTIRHIWLGQKDAQISDQTISDESLLKATESGHAPDRLFKEGVIDANTTVRHIKLSPKEFVKTEEIVFTVPTSGQPLEFSEPGQTFSSEGLVTHIKLGQKEVLSSEHFVYQGSVSESSGISSSGEDILEEGGPMEISRSTRHIRLSPSETHAEQIIFHGPVSETVRVGTADRSPTDGPTESSKPVGHIKIGPKEASFTFQMDVTNVAGGGQDATILVPDRKTAAAYQLEGTMKDGQKESGQSSEESTFDQTVQLQRMVDQRSVVSDEKKIALLYLNENDGEEEEDGPWF